MALPEELMSILVCPDCHGDLEERPLPPTPSPHAGRGAGDTVLVCLQCGLHYPVRDGIPVMLIEEAFRPPGGLGGEAARRSGESGEEPPAPQEGGKGST